MAAAAGAQARRANVYETIYITRPDTSAEDADKVASRVSEVVGRLDGKLVRVDNWGKRKLAYTIRKMTRATFVYVKYVGYNDLVAELERNFRLLDPIIRYQTIVVERAVDPESFEVDPEEVKFLHIESEEDEEEPGLEQQLGLTDESSKESSEDEGRERTAEASSRSDDDSEGKTGKDDKRRSSDEEEEE